MSSKTLSKSSISLQKKIMNLIETHLLIRGILTVAPNPHLCMTILSLKSMLLSQSFQWKRTSSAIQPASLPEKLLSQTTKLKKNLNPQGSLYSKWFHQSRASIEQQTKTQNRFQNTIKKNKNINRTLEKAYWNQILWGKTTANSFPKNTLTIQSIALKKHFNECLMQVMWHIINLGQRAKDKNSELSIALINFVKDL